MKRYSDYMASDLHEQFLILHMLQIHNALKPHVCAFPNCNKSYYHIRSLRKHEKTHPDFEMYAQENQRMQLLQSMNQAQFNHLQHQALWSPINGAQITRLSWEYPRSGITEPNPISRQVLPRPA